MLKNRFTALFIVVAVIAVMCVSCGKNTLPPELPPDNADVTENTETQKNPVEQYPENVGENTENTEPNGTDEPEQSVKPENTVSYEYSISDITDLSTFDDSKYSIFEIYDESGANVSGIADIDGNIIYAEENAFFAWCDEHKWISAYSESESYPELDGYIFGQCAHGGEIPYAGIYDVKTDKKYLCEYGEGFMGLTECEEFPEYLPYLVYDGSLTVTDGEGYATEEFMQYFDENYWGSGFEYEFTDVRGNAVPLGFCGNMPHGFTNGYLAFTRNGKYGYVNEYGEDVTEFVYDGAETAYGGFAWVCEDGKWQVINLERN